MADIDWTDSEGGGWTTASNWSGGKVPGAGDDVTIAVLPADVSYVVYLGSFETPSSIDVRSLTLDQTDATLSLTDTQLSTDLILDAGLISLNLSSLSGTIVGNGGFVEDVFAASLMQETIEGSLQLNGNSTIYGGLTLAPRDHAAATLTLSGLVTAAGAQSFKGGTIVLGADTYVDDPTSSPGSLTALTLNSDVIFDGPGVLIQASTIVNDGTIAGASAGGSLSLSVGTLLNAGHMLAAQGDTISIDASSVINHGTILVTAGGTLAVAATHWWSNGAIDIAGGTLVLDGPTITLAQLKLAAFTDGGVALLDGALANAHRTLALGAASGLRSLELGPLGSIEGGTLVSNGGLTFDGGTLSGVTFETELDLSETGSSLTVTGGLSGRATSGSGPGTVMLTGAGATLEVSGVGTLSNMDIEAGSSGATLNFDSSIDTGYTLAAGSALVQAGAAFTMSNEFAGSSTVPVFINRGTINADVAGGAFVIDGPSIDNDGTIRVGDGDALFIEGLSPFNNAGAIDVTSGGTLAIGSQEVTSTGRISLAGAVLDLQYADLAEVQSIALADTVAEVTGTLALQGGTLDLANSGLTLFRVGTGATPGTLASVVTGGTIADPTGRLQLAGYSVFSGATYQGTLDLSRPLASLALTDGSSVTDATGKMPGLIDLTGAGASLAADRLDQVTIDIGSAVLNYEGTIFAPATLSTPVLGAGVTVSQTGTYAAIFDQSDDTSSLATAATIDADVTRGSFGIWGGAVTNSGSITVGNEDTVTIGSAHFVSEGLITIGNAQGSGAITIDTYAYFASGSLAQSNFTNAGTVLLSGGGIGELSNDDALSNVPMLNEGSIKGSGTIDVDMINSGVVEATSGGEISMERVVGGVGTLQVDAGAFLQLAAVEGRQTVLFSGVGGALTLAPMSFLGKIAGFASGDTIELLNTVANSASFVGDSILVSLTAGGTLTLDTSSALSGSLTVAAVGQHDSLISFAGSSAHYPLFTPAHSS